MVLATMVHFDVEAEEDADPMVLKDFGIKIDGDPESLRRGEIGTGLGGCEEVVKEDDEKSQIILSLKQLEPSHKTISSRVL